MKKITAWVKGHKIAAVFIGAGTFVFVVFAALLVSGLILMANGYEAEVEPVAEATQEPAKKAEEPKTEKSVEKPKETKVPEPKRAETPKVEKPKAEKAEPKTEPPEPKKADPATDLTKRMKATQGELDVFFDSCKWENKTVDEGAFLVAMSACESESLGVMVADNDTAPKLIIEQMADDGVSGKYILEDGLAVWSTDAGTLNMAWDVLGTPGTPTEF